MKNARILFATLLPVLLLSLLACQDDDDPPTDPGEVITDVRLIFSPLEGSPLIYQASIPEGQHELLAEETIVLASQTVYQLFIQLENFDTDEDVSAIVKQAADEHMFFFEFTENLFANPPGKGNMDQRAAYAVAYQDTDANELPLGFITNWVAGAAAEGWFRIVLKHQPEEKSPTSTAADGYTAMDVTWQLIIQ